MERRYIVPRRRRHRRRGDDWARGSRWGSPLVQLVFAGLLIILSFWAGMVLQLTRATAREEHEMPSDLTVGVQPAGDIIAGVSIHRPAASPKTKEGGIGGGDGGGGGAVKHRGGGSALNHQGTSREKPGPAQSFYHKVDFQGGDIREIGPVEAESARECRSLCVFDGRCLKWTFQEKEMVCWLKDAGGTRREQVAGVTSGIVRTKQDKTLPTPKYGELPIPPIKCCPDSAADPPPGVHAYDLWDDQPAADWTASYPLGNGFLGAMLGMGTFKDTIFLSDGGLWAGKGKTAGRAGFPHSPDRYQEFQKAREALLNGDTIAAQEAAGRMPTDPDGFVSSFEYAGELHLEFGGNSEDSGGGSEQPLGREAGWGSVDGYVRHLHLNNATAEAAFDSVGGVDLATNRVRRLHHHREVFVSNVDGVLAMRFSCEEEKSGKGCVSFLAMPKREGNSHFTEAWQIPAPRAWQEHAGSDTSAEGMDGSEDHTRGREGAYVGLFRPPGGEKSEMGFHMCVAVIPLRGGEGAEGAGAVPEEYLDQQSQRRQPEGHRGPESNAEIAKMARQGHGQGGATGQQNHGPERFAQNLPLRHRVALTTDAAITEAMVLISIATEQEHSATNDKRQGWHPSTFEPAAGRNAYGGGWGSQENPEVLWPYGMEGNMEGGGNEHRQMRRRCLETVEAAAVLGFEELRRRHIDDVVALFDRVHFSLESASDGGGTTDGGEASLASSGSCVAGLPIRTRVSRSGKACTEEGEEGRLDPAGGRTVVDDGLIELMYHYGRYLMISGSRPGGRPLNLQGIWANSLKAKWEGDYHMNINLQMSYWGAHTAGLPECAVPLVPFVEALSDSGRQTAHSYYRAAGWVSHANTDRWGGTAAHGDSSWALCPTCGAWMALHLWEAYEYTRDASLLLASVVPVLAAAVEFFLSYMVLADDGLGDGTCLLTGPSTSPENSLPAVKNLVKHGLEPPVTEKLTSKTGTNKAAPKKPPAVIFPFVAMSPAIDVAIVRQLIEDFGSASREALLKLELLQKGGPPLSGLPAGWTEEDAPRLFNPKGAWQTAAVSNSLTDVSERLRRLTARSEEALSRLPNNGQPSIGEDGMLREYRGVDASDLPDPGHRHSSGLWALYPGSQVSPGQDEGVFEAAAATVQYKVDKGGGHTSWSRAWLVNLRARLFQGTEALGSLRGILRDQCVGSMFSLHPALTRSRGKGLAECNGCYEFREQKKLKSRKKKPPLRAESGLVTEDGAVFQIDGNLGFLAGVNEMLLHSRYRYPNSGEEDSSSTQHSHPDTIEIRLLPALPDDWQAGAFRGLRTRGGYEVGVKWDQGVITSANLRPVVDRGSGSGGRNNGESARAEVKPTRCRVRSRSRLNARLTVDGEAAYPPDDTWLALDQESVVEGGILWYSVSVEAPQPGEQVIFSPIGS
eukprot:g13181.t3